MVLQEDGISSKRPLVWLVAKLTERRKAKPRCSKERAGPQLGERRMLWIDPEVSGLDIGDAGSNVVILVDCETIEARRNNGMKQGSGNQRQEQK